MDAIPTGRLARALAALDPADRALLELAYRRGLAPTEVADLLGDSLASVVDRRDSALAALDEELGGDRLGPDLEHALAQAEDEAWSAGAGAGEPAAVEEPGAPDTGPEQDTAAETASEADAVDTASEAETAAPRRRGLGSLRRRLILFGLAALLLGIAAGILIATSGDGAEDGERGGETGQATERRESRRQPAAPRRLGPLVELTPQIEGIEGAATARLVRTRGRVRLALRARDLSEPRGYYEVWLLDAPRRARSLARFRTSDFDLDAPLPRDFGSYQQLDVTLEVEDGNEDHSGASVFRTEISELAFD